MVSVHCDISVSLDGFTTGLEAQKPPFLDDRFFRVTDWILGTDPIAKSVQAERVGETGVYVMGRHMYDAAGEHWSVESPYKTDVFVVTHRPHDPVALADGTTFRFVTDGVAAAIEEAKRICPADKRVHVSGGAVVVQQALAADLIDTLYLHISPVLIGQGTRLFDNLPDRMVELEPAGMTDAAGMTHLRFRFPRAQKAESA